MSRGEIDPSDGELILFQPFGNATGFRMRLEELRYFLPGWWKVWTSVRRAQYSPDFAIKVERYVDTFRERYGLPL